MKKNILFILFAIFCIDAYAGPISDIKINKDCNFISKTLESYGATVKDKNDWSILMTWKYNSKKNFIYLNCENSLLKSFTMLSKHKNEASSLAYYRRLHADIVRELGEPLVNNEELIHNPPKDRYGFPRVTEENKYASLWETETQQIMISNMHLSSYWSASLEISSIQP